MEPRNRFQGIDSASLCSLASRFDKHGCRTGPLGWKSIPGLFNRSTNKGSGLYAGFIIDFCSAVAKFLVSDRGPPAYVALQASMTTLCQSRHVMEFGLCLLDLLLTWSLLNSASVTSWGSRCSAPSQHLLNPPPPPPSFWVKPCLQLRTLEL